MALRTVSLCAGIGGMDTALHGVARTVLYVEREAFAVACLVKAMQEGRMAQAPVWSDLTTLDARAWRGGVDLVCSGLPCQPYSVAGNMLGNEDARALWPELVRIVRDCEPGLVFIENTPEFLSHAEPVWRELRGLGFHWCPPFFSTATEYGAIHIRRRVFLLAAHTDRIDFWDKSWRSGWTCGANSSVDRNAGEATADTDSVAQRQPRESTVRPKGWRSGNAHGDSQHIADPDRRRLSSEWVGWIFDRERQTFRHDSERCDPGCRTCRSQWAIESPVCRVDAGIPARAHRLHVLGNSVVPVQAANAFNYLVSTIP